MVLGVRVCAEHVAPAIDIKASTQEDQPLRHVFMAIAAGKCAPDFDRAFVTKARLDSEECRVLFGMKPDANPNL